MPNVRRILLEKSREADALGGMGAMESTGGAPGLLPVVTIAPEASVLEAAQLMNDHRIGALVVVVPGTDGVAGIFTERDVMRRVVAAQRDVGDTCVVDVMTTPVACAGPRTTTDELRRVMREKRIRHVPIVDDDDHLIGMVSIGDLNRAVHRSDEETILYLEQYISVL